MEFEKLLVEVAEILEKLGIKYCITGGYAVSIWGKPRGTFDIDVIIRLEAEDIAPLAKNLRSLSRAGYIEESAAREAVTRGGEFNFVHPESGIKIDFWVINEGDRIGMNELQRRQVSRTLGGKKIYLISPEDLILSKLRWHSESQSTRHLEDIESIFKFSGDKLDMDYLKHWAEKQGTLELLKNALPQ
jgi:hypothetical protein